MKADTIDWKWDKNPMSRLSTRPRPLAEDEFSELVRLGPLASIDIILCDPENHVLVALRNNEPAKGFYFVPGSCIRKDEPIKDAFTAILWEETGCEADLAQAQFLNVYEHIYPNNRSGRLGFGTHYVVLAYRLQFDHRPKITLDDQHSAIKWLTPSELLTLDDVHPYTKRYFL
jgi:colanic acid biosynthesis protein WcaH